LEIYQRSSGDKVVDLFYEYTALEEINDSFLEVQFSADNGATWSVVPTNSLKGDFGENVMPGRRRVTWLPEQDLADVEVEGNVLARLIMYDVDNNRAGGDRVTGVLTWGVDQPEVAIRTLNLEEEIEIQRDASSTSSSSSSSSSSLNSSLSSSSSS
jgi:hypothetical protein